jgi:hypothetical protein
VNAKADASLRELGGAVAGQDLFAPLLLCVLLVRLIFARLRPAGSGAAPFDSRKVEVRGGIGRLSTHLQFQNGDGHFSELTKPLLSKDCF